MKVTYIKHSGFLVETADVCLLFDYFQGGLPELDTGKQMLVFVSHGHGDHFGKEIFCLAEQFRNISFILSSDIKPDHYRKYGNIISAGPGMKFEVSGTDVRTLRSNDLGVAYIVHAGGKTVYHAGDLNWWHWEGEADKFNRVMRRSYQSEIDKLCGEMIDTAFVPVDPRLGDQYCLGLDYFMRGTDTKHVFPMHFWGNYEIFDRLMHETCTEEYRDRIIRIECEGQIFDIR